MTLRLGTSGRPRTDRTPVRQALFVPEVLLGLPLPTPVLLRHFRPSPVFPPTSRPDPSDLSHTSTSDPHVPSPDQTQEVT